MKKRAALFLALFSLACQLANGITPTPYPEGFVSTAVAATQHAALTLTAAAMGTLTPTPTLTLTPSLTPSVTSSPTLAPYEPYTIPYLQRRTYGGGEIESLGVIEEKSAFTRYLFRYPSDGLTIYGFANIPKGDGTFPVIIAIHGFAYASTYQTLDYTTINADMIAAKGYIVLHPNLRGYPPSDDGDNLFRVGLAVDALNLISLVKSRSGAEELFAKADSDNIGMWGHSMGGNVVLRALIVSRDIKAAVLYASLGGDELKNSALLADIGSNPLFESEKIVSPAIMQNISPKYFYEDIHASVQLYHGLKDGVVQISWAEDNCAALKNAGVKIKCIYYPKEGHGFSRNVWDEFYDSMAVFYKTYLKP